MPQPTFQSNRAISIRSISVKSSSLLYISTLLLLFCCISSHAAAGQSMHGNMPHFASSAMVLGREDSDKVIEISAWLQPHNQASLDALAQNLYDPDSPSYRHWLTPDDLTNRFAPTSAEAKTVQSYLESKGLKLVRMGPNNFYVRVSGTVRNVEAAFHLNLNQYQMGARIVRANDSEPYLDQEVAPLIRHISGLDSVEYASTAVSRPAAPAGGALSQQVVSEANITPGFFTSDCFTGFRIANFTTNGTYPLAYYHGNNYTAAQPGCGYTPGEIQTAYGLNTLYQRGFDGTGQTIVVIGLCGSPTITADANAFSAMFGLPPLTAANFKILQSAPSTCAQPFNENVNTPVEWAHAIAPGANIDLLIAPDSDTQDVDQALLYAINNHLGNVISGTYGTPEAFVSDAELVTQNQILEMAAVSGISANFPTGDQGDGDDGISTHGPTVDTPASAPYATAVGGITLALNSDNSIAWQTGWGTNEGGLRRGGVLGFGYPVATGSLGASGGGTSGTFAKPPFQHALPGKLRLVPDVSWVADYFTAGVIAITHPGQFPPIEYMPTGGTGMAVAMFSGLWAIANQAAKTPLGQAAPYLYAGYNGALPAASITDIVPYSDGANVTGDFRASAASTTVYHSWTLADVPQGTVFYSAFYDSPDEQDTTLLLIFGLDSTLTLTKGWDNVTGVGAPNPVAMINAIIEKFK
jgi:subtilase family serine protease